MRFSDFLFLLENLFYAALAAAFVYGLYRYYYRSIPRSGIMDYSLMPAGIFASFLFYQFGAWPALTILLVLIFALIHFRTVIREPSDALFIFWALLSGILTGIGLNLYPVLANIVICLFGMLFIRWKQTKLPYLLLVRYDTIINPELMCMLKPLKGKVREQAVLDSICELKFELSARHIDLDLIRDISELQGVHETLMLPAEEWI